MLTRGVFGCSCFSCYVCCGLPFAWVFRFVVKCLIVDGIYSDVSLGFTITTCVEFTWIVTYLLCCDYFVFACYLGMFNISFWVVGYCLRVGLQLRGCLWLATILFVCLMFAGLLLRMVLRCSVLF